MSSFVLATGTGSAILVLVVLALVLVPLLFIAAGAVVVLFALWPARKLKGGFGQRMRELPFTRQLLLGLGLAMQLAGFIGGYWALGVVRHGL